MKLSIIIVNYNTWEYLSKTLKAIYTLPINYEFEVIVVDNNSKDGIRENLTKNFNKVKIIKNAKNVGFARANNQAIPRSKGEYVLFLNPDAIPTKDAINNMIEFMDKYQYVGCLGGKLVYPTGEVQLSCRKFPTYISILFGRRSLLRKIFPGNPFSKEYLLTNIDYNKIQKVDWVMGACLMTRRSILEQLGYFDEQFFLFVEDLDFCYKVNKAGYEVYYLPNAVFYHHHGVAVKKEIIKTTIAHNLSIYKFFIKNYNVNIFLKLISNIALSLRIFFIITFLKITKTAKELFFNVDKISH